MGESSGEKELDQPGEGCRRECTGEEGVTRRKIKKRLKENSFKRSHELSNPFMFGQAQGLGGGDGRSCLVVNRTSVSECPFTHPEHADCKTAHLTDDTHGQRVH